jgi:AraC-like DNA-binding protein
MRVSTVHVRALVEAFEGHGRRGEELLAAAAVDAHVLRADYAWIDVGELDRLIRVALELTQDSAFGLHWGERSSALQFDLASLVMGAAPTLREGVSSLLPFQEILGDRPEFLFVERAGRARFVFEPLAISDDVRRVRAELAVTGFWRLLDTVMPHERWAYFAHARPSHGAEYTRLFGPQLRFDQRFSGIVFPAALLDKPLLLRNASTYRALSEQANQVRSRVLAESSLRERIKQQLLRSLPEALEMQAAASAVGISERSLRRRLEDEGSSYSQLIDEAKLELSRRLLADPTLPIKRVAGQLGFADVRSFHRAFKRWTGLTPVEFRSQR